MDLVDDLPFDALPEALQPPPTQIGDLPDKIFARLVRHLRFGDLRASRLVSRQWNTNVCSSRSFLSRAVLCAEPEELLTTSSSSTWKNVKLTRLQLAATPLQLPPAALFASVESLELHKCEITWNDLKKIVISSGRLRHLTLSDCSFAHSYDPDLDDDSFEFRRLIRTLHTLVLRNTAEISSLIAQVYKFVDLWACSLQKLKIEYLRGPEEAETRPSDANYFSLVLAELIKANAQSLRSLVLNLRCPTLLAAFCPVVLPQLEPFSLLLQLRTFKLTPATPRSTSLAIASTSLASSFLIFLDFVKGQAPTLRSLAFPHFSSLGPSHQEQQHRRTAILDALHPPLVEKLRLPGHVYLKKNFLRVFTRLRLLQIGEKCGVGYAAALNPTKYVYDGPLGRAGATCRRLEQLIVCSRLNYAPGLLYHVVEKFPQLITLDLDGGIWNDKDLHAIVKHLRRLEALSLAPCDALTDAGFRGAPLAALKGLRTLKLSGSAPGMTNFALEALRFLELKSLHLPWSEAITPAGLQALVGRNPTLEELTMEAATVSTARELRKLAKRLHGGSPRLKERNCAVWKVYPDPPAAGIQTPSASRSAPELLQASAISSAANEAEETRGH